jgi:elongation factor Ts
MVTTETIKELRSITGAGIMDCKRALQQAKGDMGGAAEILRQQGYAKAEKKAHREAREGLVEVYIHTGGRIGAMVEVNCESDFVARTDDFKKLAHDIAMQVTATDPKYVCRNDIPDDETADKDADPSQLCLLSQPFIRDPQKNIQDIVTEIVAKVGENIKVRRFARFELGKD